MATPSDPFPLAVAAGQDGGCPSAAPATAWAVGMLMAATPCSARDARGILAAAADLARTTVHGLAAAMTAASQGTPLPAPVERALRHAVEAARGAAPVAKIRGTALVPSRARTEEVLNRLRACRARLAAAPDDPAALRDMDDVTYTLCVLMGRPTTHEAVRAAEELLAGPAGRTDLLNEEAGPAA
ncbi:DUF5133 domain-containing protein [Streptomyces sp. NPDC054787]